MKKIYRFFTCLSFSFAVLFVLSGCSKQIDITWYDFQAEYSSMKSSVVAENKRYSLEWDNETACVTLVDKETGNRWSNIPENAKEYTTHPQVYSPITIEYIDNEKLDLGTAVAYTSSIKKDAFSAEKIDDGIQVTYYFEDIAISVPVKYVLREDSLYVSVDPTEIGEDEYMCCSVSLLPFMCSVNNNEQAEDRYLFVPSGSGALIYPKITGEGITSVITEEIYGEHMQVNNYPTTNKESVHLPVYGARNKDRGICAIIEKSAEAAKLTTNVGSSTVGYSAVYSSFNIRGFQVSEAVYMKNMKSQKSLFAKQKIQEEIAVAFYPLNNEEASYNGMAKCYQNYLVQEKKMTVTAEDTLLNLKYIGGVETKKFIFGVPYYSLMCTTKFEDVERITKDMQDYYTGMSNVNLLGFGKSGYDIGEIAGGMKYNRKFGSLKQLKSINDNEKVSLYFDFDLIRYNESGQGVNTLTDVAKTAIGGKFEKLYTNIQYSGYISGGKKYHAVARDQLNKVSDQLLKKIDNWEINGVSYHTLSKLSYSDYSDVKYYAKLGMAEQVDDIIKKTNDKGYKVGVSNANDYAAIHANQIYDVPTQSSAYQVYDCDVPFYQMVFKGYVPMSVSSLNFADNHRKQLLQAIETGCGLTYTLINEYDTDLLLADANTFYAAVYEDNKEVIKSDIELYEPVFKKVANTAICKHVILSDEVRQTTYENGVTIYVNYGNTDVTLPNGKQISAQGFLVEGEERQ